MTSLDKFEVPLYKAMCYVIIYDNLDNLKKLNKRRGIELEITDKYNTAAGFAVEMLSDSGVNQFLFMCEEHITNGVIAHECMHITQRVLERVGIPWLKGDANEAYTYLLENLVGRVTKIVAKRTT